MRRNAFTTPGQVLSALFRERDWERQWELHEAYARWPEIAGPEAAAHSAPVAVRNGVLWLYVRHSGWAQDLRFRQDELLRRVRPLLPDRPLRGIRCQVEPDWFADGKTPAPPRPSAEPVPASFAAIADDACREALIRLWRLARAQGR